MPEEWEIITLPSFNAGVEKHQLDQDKLQKWCSDLKKSPTKMKDAHALKGTWKYHWAADFNTGTTFTVVSLWCGGKKELCFLGKGVKVDAGYVDFLKNISEKGKGKIFLIEVGPHQKDYRFS